MSQDNRDNRNRPQQQGQGSQGGGQTAQQPAASAPAADPAKPAVQAQPLLERDLKNYEGGSNNTWRALLRNGTPFNAVFEPTFFSNCAAKFNIGDKIVVFNPEMTFWGEVIVRGNDRRSKVVVGLVSHTEWANLQALKDSVYDIKQRGQLEEWFVVNTKDGSQFGQNFTSFTAANTWLQGQLAAMRA